GRPGALAADLGAPADVAGFVEAVDDHRLVDGRAAVADEAGRLVERGAVPEAEAALLDAARAEDVPVRVAALVDLDGDPAAAVADRQATGAEAVGRVCARVGQ